MVKRSMITRPLSVAAVLGFSLLTSSPAQAAGYDAFGLPAVEVVTSFNSQKESVLQIGEVLGVTVDDNGNIYETDAYLQKTNGDMHDRYPLSHYEQIDTDGIPGADAVIIPAGEIPDGEYDLIFTSTISSADENMQTVSTAYPILQGIVFNSDYIADQASSSAQEDQEVVKAITAPEEIVENDTEDLGILGELLVEEEAVQAVTPAPQPSIPVEGTGVIVAEEANTSIEETAPVPATPEEVVDSVLSTPEDIPNMVNSIPVDQVVHTAESAVATVNEALPVNEVEELVNQVVETAAPVVEQAGQEISEAYTTQVEPRVQEAFQTAQAQVEPAYQAVAPIIEEATTKVQEASSAAVEQSPISPEEVKTFFNQLAEEVKSKSEAVVGNHASNAANVQGYNTQQEIANVETSGVSYQADSTNTNSPVATPSLEGFSIKSAIVGALSVMLVFFTGMAIRQSRLNKKTN